ncbi:hypothetical protein BV25DRAFT_1762217, partial [Artomyces pyxidatus]
ILDDKGRVLVKMAGRPGGTQDWQDVARDASAAMLAEAQALGLSEKASQHARGTYPVLHAGFSHGVGPTTPYNIYYAKDCPKGAAIRRLVRHPAFLRLSAFASSAFSVAAPRLFEHYEEVVSRAQGAQPGLEKPFKNSVFPTATFNFGPQAVTYCHKDHLNVPYGWCAVTALGNYDPTKGGHLYLWELKLVIEFPPGSTILLPSAILTHGNTPIASGEVRQAFTQYCAGSLARWCMYGFRTAALVQRSAPEVKKYLD